MHFTVKFSNNLHAENLHKNDAPTHNAIFCNKTLLNTQNLKNQISASAFVIYSIVCAKQTYHGSKKS